MSERRISCARPSTASTALVLGLTGLLTTGCFFGTGLSVSVHSIDGEVLGVFISTNASVSHCNPVGPGSSYACSFFPDDGPISRFTIESLPDYLRLLTLIDPLVIQLPAEASGFSGAFLHHDSGTNGSLLITAGLGSVPIDDTRSLVAEPGTQLVIVELPPDAPTSGNFAFNYTFTMPPGTTEIVTKPLFTGRVELTDGRVFYAPLYPCGSNMADMPELVIPVPVPGGTLSIPPPNPSLACLDETYSYGQDPGPPPGHGASTWFLAEGANNAIFTEEILVGNSSGHPLDVTVTLLPQADAVAPQLTRTFALAPTARLTVHLSDDFDLNGSASALVTAVIAGTSTQADIAVERTMFFPDEMRPGAHNAGGVTQAAPSWTLAEGATTIFDTFVLVANVNATETLVRATYLTGTGEEYVSEQIAGAHSRVTFWPRQEHPALQAAVFSTFVESLTAGNDVVAERAMYFNDLHAGHDALGVATPSTTWYFAEGFTGGHADVAFETFLLLANTGTTDAVATVDYLLTTGEVVTIDYPVAARSRFTVWVDQEGRTVDSRLATAAFGIRVTSTEPIVVERSMYWGAPSLEDPGTPVMPWVEGHATAGADAPAASWAFAEGQQGVFGATGTTYDSFFLLANLNMTPIAVQATFVREDGSGIVREVCVPANARTNIWTAEHPELSGHRFATFLATVSSATCAGAGGETFVAERAVYVGPGFGAGHVNMGTPWTSSIATPPMSVVVPTP
jgi:hypothetical protein